MLKVIYLNLNNCVEVQKDEVRLKDVAKIYAQDKKMETQANEMVIFSFSRKVRTQVISSLYLVQLLSETFPGISVWNVGEKDVVIQRKDKAQEQRLTVKLQEVSKTALICILSFLGAGFTIMAFHNDVGIRQFFAGIYYEITGIESNGFTVLEIFYSIGLAAGILIFFNHFGKKRFTDDPTPVEVEMKMYENDINTALIEIAERKGESM